MSQSTFDFGALGESVTQGTKKKPIKKAQNHEQMACALEATNDYRVLRRLVPKLEFGPCQGDTTWVLILDTETTGLSHASDKIIELAMLLVQVDLVTGLPCGAVEVFEGFEDPGMPIPEVARQVTGITDEMVQGKSLDEAAVNRMLSKADVVIAHNAGFDRPFMEARFPAFASKPCTCSFKDIDWKAEDVDSAKLTALAADAGWFYDAHRALMDCHALLAVVVQRIKDKQESRLGRLISKRERLSYKLCATGAPFAAKDTLKTRGYRWDADQRVWCCILGNEAELDAELGWLAEQVFDRTTEVDVEISDAMTLYSARRGRLDRRRIRAT